MQTAHQMRTRVIDRASTDPEFRALLLSAPKQAIHRELGVAIPESMSVFVHEDSARTFHLALPPSSRLEYSDLARISGGPEANRDHRRHKDLHWYDIRNW